MAKVVGWLMGMLQHRLKISPPRCWQQWVAGFDFVGILFTKTAPMVTEVQCTRVGPSIKFSMLNSQVTFDPPLVPTRYIGVERGKSCIYHHPRTWTLIWKWRRLQQSCWTTVPGDSFWTVKKGTFMLPDSASEHISGRYSLFVGWGGIYRWRKSPGTLDRALYSTTPIFYLTSLQKLHSHCCWANLTTCMYTMYSQEFCVLLLPKFWRWVQKALTTWQHWRELWSCTPKDIWLQAQLPASLGGLQAASRPQARHRGLSLHRAARVTIRIKQNNHLHPRS